MSRNEITIYLKDKNTKLFFELLTQTYEISMPSLYKKIPRSSLYDIRKYIKEYEKAKGIRIIKERVGVSQNKQLMKVLRNKFPIQIIGNIALIDVSNAVQDFQTPVRKF